MFASRADIVTFTKNGVFDASKKIEDPSLDPALIGSTTTAEESKAVCKQVFTLSKDDVRRFFREAEFSDHLGHSGVLARTCCYAKGQATLKDGRKVDWFINRDGGGELSISGYANGHDRDMTFYLFKWKPAPR
jgi:hypothetical protein